MEQFMTVEGRKESALEEQEEKMDSLKIFKGYDKVEQNKHYHPEDQQKQHHHPKTSKHLLIATISIITILLLILTLTFTLVHHHHTNTESPKPLNSAEAIRAVCNVTRFPDSCIAAVSSFAAQSPTDPESILKLSLRASIDEIRKLSKSFASNSKGHALADCKDQIDDAVSRLNDSLSAVPDGAVTLTDVKINDIRTWVSAALTDQETCVDGLEEVGSSVGTVDEVKRMMKRSSEYTSNSLAIVANMRTLLRQFHVPLH